MNSSLHSTDTASILNDPLCRALCASLSDRRARTVNELARAARVAASSATGQLERLVASGIFCAESHRQRRYYRIATSHSAEVIEALKKSGIVTPTRAIPSSVPVRLRAARTCYDHLAGPLAVGLCEALENAGIIVREGSDYQLGSGGAEWMWDAGIEVADARGTRTFATCCLDWSERRPHVGGRLGAAILRRLIDSRLAVHGKGREMAISGGLPAILEDLGLAEQPATTTPK